MHDKGTDKQADHRICTPGLVQAVRSNSDLPVQAWGAASTGLTNAPATFQRALDIMLPRLNWQLCLVYLHDGIILSASAEQHVKDVDVVLTRLREAGWHRQPMVNTRMRCKRGLLSVGRAKWHLPIACRTVQGGKYLRIS